MSEISYLYVSSSIYKKSFMNYERFQSIMSFLIERRFIEMSKNEDNRALSSNRKGYTFLTCIQ
jgi:predicted transcriptional regulator